MGPLPSSARQQARRDLWRVLPLNAWPTAQAYPGCEPPLLLCLLFLNLPVAAPDEEAAVGGRRTGRPRVTIVHLHQQLRGPRGSRRPLAGRPQPASWLPPRAPGGRPGPQAPTIKGWHILLRNEVLRMVPPTFWPGRAFLLSTHLECALGPGQGQVVWAGPELGLGGAGLHFYSHAPGAGVAAEAVSYPASHVTHPSSLSGATLAQLEPTWLAGSGFASLPPSWQPLLRVS